MGFSVVKVCAGCGAKNRVPASHLAHTGRCGACKQPLPPQREPLDVDAAGFQEIVRTVPVPVLVDFWAGWCGPCRTAAPVVHQLAESMAGKALVLKVDVDAVPELASAFRVQSIPNFVVMRGGRPVFERPGLASLPEMRRWLEDASSAPTART